MSRKLGVFFLCELYYTKDVNHVEPMRATTTTKNTENVHKTNEIPLFLDFVDENWMLVNFSLDFESPL